MIWLGPVRGITGFPYYSSVTDVITGYHSVSGNFYWFLSHTQKNNKEWLWVVAWMQGRNSVRVEKRKNIVRFKRDKRSIQKSGRTKLLPILPILFCLWSGNGWRFSCPQCINERFSPLDLQMPLDVNSQKTQLAWLMVKSLRICVRTTSGTHKIRNPPQ